MAALTPKELEGIRHTWVYNDWQKVFEDKHKLEEHIDALQDEVNDLHQKLARIESAISSR